MQGFELRRDGTPVALPLTAQRLIAFLAIGRRPLMRQYVSGTLWPDSSEVKAHGSLRSALWRLQRSAPGSIASSGALLAVSSRVEVDVHEAVDRAHSVLRDGATNRGGEPWAGQPSEFDFDLLPDWYDEWLVPERERVRQLQLHALGALSAQLRNTGAHAHAVEAAQLAVAVDPTRESARRALVEAHLAEGNVHAALREYVRFRDLLRRELGVEPSARMTELLPASLRANELPPTSGWSLHRTA